MSEETGANNEAKNEAKNGVELGIKSGDKIKIGIAEKLSFIDWEVYKSNNNLSRDDVIETFRREFPKYKFDGIIASDARQTENKAAIREVAPDAISVDINAIMRGEEIHDIDVLVAYGGDDWSKICIPYFHDKIVLLANSDTETSLGGMLYFDRDSLIDKLPKIREGDFDVEHWTKIAAELNGRELRNAMSEYYFRAGPLMTRFLIRSNGKEEDIRCTSFLVASGIGSEYGSYYYGITKPLVSLKDGVPFAECDPSFPRESREVRSVVETPHPDMTKYSLLNLAIKEGHELRVDYWSKKAGWISADGAETYDLPQRGRMTFRVSDEPLRVIRP